MFIHLFCFSLYLKVSWKNIHLFLHWIPEYHPNQAVRMDQCHLQLKPFWNRYQMKKADLMHDKFIRGQDFFSKNSNLLDFQISKFLNSFYFTFLSHRTWCSSHSRQPFIALLSFIPTFTFITYKIKNREKIKLQSIRRKEINESKLKKPL